MWFHRAVRGGRVDVLLRRLWHPCAMVFQGCRCPAVLGVPFMFFAAPLSVMPACQGAGRIRLFELAHPKAVEVSVSGQGLPGGTYRALHRIASRNAVQG